MTDTIVSPAQPTTTPIEKIDAEDGRFDMDAMKEFSLQEADKEIQQTKKGKQNGNKKESDEEGDEESDSEETAEEGGEEEESDGADSDDISDDDGLEEESEDEESEDEEESDSEDESDSKKFIVAKKGDKEIKIPKDAKFSVKVNGKMEELTAQEIVNKASGVVNIERETSRLGREKTQLQTEKTQWKQKVGTYQENLSFLNKLTEEGTLEDVCEFFGSISGKEPTAVLEDLMTRVEGYVKQFEGMTEREKQLYNENRRYKLKQSLAESRQQQTAKKTQQESEIAEVRKELAGHGLSDDDWIAAAEEIQQKLRDGELDAEMDAFEIVDYAVKKKVELNVKTAISSVSESASKDETFVKRVLKAVTTAEQLSGEKFSPKELKQLVRSALDRRKKSLSESLSRKVAKADRSGKTSSKNATSRKQGKSGPINLSEHRAMLENEESSEKWGYDE